MKKIMLSAMLLSSVILVKAQTVNQITTTRQEHTINVNGSAEMEVVPDEIYVQVDLKEYKKGSNKTDIESIKNAFLANMKTLGYTEQEISVQGYSGWDGNNTWYAKKKKNPDLLAGISYWVKVSSPAKMDAMVNKLDDEATTNFFIAKTSHSKITEYKKQLKTDAIKAAKAKAEYLAAAINEKVGQAITINDPSEAGIHSPVMYANTRFKSGDVTESPMNVDFKKIKLQFDVNVVFALL